MNLQSVVNKGRLHQGLAMEIRPLDEQPLLRNDMNVHESEIKQDHFEDTPAYVALRDVLETS